MPIREAEAVVLRHYPLAESDRIVVLLTREYGKVRVVAKGIKKMKSRLGGCLEPLNHVRVEFYVREGRDLSYVRQCDMIHPFLGKNPTLDRVCAFNYFAELTQEFVQEDQPSELFFRLLLAALAAGEASGGNEALVRYFELWSLRLGGFLPNSAYCSGCGACVKDIGFYAWIEAGQVQCTRCAQRRGMYIGPAVSRTLQRISELSPEAFAAHPLPARSGEDLERFAQALLQLHLEKRLKSYAVLKQVLWSERSVP
jgi:DNA repair protein RecO (recombination protein O)